MEQSPDLTQLKEIIVGLEGRITKADLKNKMQKDFFVQYIRIFQKLSQKLALLSSKINEEILSSQDTNDEAIGNIFQHLSNTLLRMADCSRNVSVKAKNQVLDPMKLFCENYSVLNTGLLKKLKKREIQLNEKYSEMRRNRDLYYTMCDRFDKQKKQQNKIMSKIENGDLSYLEKFNVSLSKGTESIKNCQAHYKRSVDFVNDALVESRKELRDMMESMTYNEESRVVFSKKSLVSSIRILEDFTSFFDTGVEKKIQQSLKLLDSEKSENMVKKRISLLISLLSKSNYFEEFVSHEEVMRKKRKESLKEENSYLQEIFYYVRQSDKEIIHLIINPWFSQENPKKKNVHGQKEIDECKQKILSLQPYSFYFIQTVYERIIEMTSFYLKLFDENFIFLLNTLTTITNNLELIQNTNSSALGIQFLYKMIQISLRISWKKNSSKSHPIELLCQSYGSKNKTLTNQIILKKLYFYIVKKKSQRKIAEGQSKSVMGALMKGFGVVMNKKKQPTLSTDEAFSCLTEITQIMANLLTPTQVAIPFIKSILQKNENSKSFDYLKSILLEKKDQQERQKIFFKTEIKGKKEEEMRIAFENKKISEYAIKLIAKRGFFDKDNLNLRLVNSNLSNIHLQILPHLNIPPSEKWTKLIPLNRALNYIEMKRQVAENSFPSTIEEIITLDVNRSLHNHGENLNPTILHSLLRTYAYYHKDISYCQGMNYIAGYLYIKIGDEELTYRIFEYLMEVRFKELFANEFEILKIKMYQFERLLGIFHPEINDHFKKQAISPECYIVSWMITLFASSYQYTMESYLIDLLWERFIVWGWAQFFKFVLSLFNLYREDLLDLTYDKALHFLGEMGKSEMFLANRSKYFEKYPDNVVEAQLNQYPISAELLANLEKQYKLD